MTGLSNEQLTALVARVHAVRGGGFASRGRPQRCRFLQRRCNSCATVPVAAELRTAGAAGRDRPASWYRPLVNGVGLSVHYRAAGCPTSPKILSTRSASHRRVRHSRQQRSYSHADDEVKHRCRHLLLHRSANN